MTTIPPTDVEHITREDGTVLHMDNRFNIWTCPCMSKNKTLVSLNLTQDKMLINRGELADISREIAIRRKELNLLYTDNIEEIIKKYHEETTNS